MAIFQTALTMRSGSSPANTTLAVVSDSPTQLLIAKVYETEPIGGVPWTQSLLDAVEVGGSDPNTATSKITECYLSVLFTPGEASAGPARPVFTNQYRQRVT